MVVEGRAARYGGGGTAPSLGGTMQQHRGNALATGRTRGGGLPEVEGDVMSGQEVDLNQRWRGEDEWRLMAGA
jgi:hypothetical protein